MRAIITGSGGLVGSETVRHFVTLGFEVFGFDNDMRRHFFGDEASTLENTNRLASEFREFMPMRVDIRDAAEVSHWVGLIKPDLVIHCAAQPAHDWAAKDPRTDFEVNAIGTLNMLEATRAHCPDSPFVHVSTSKVYGDNPNSLPLRDDYLRLDLPLDHEYRDGIKTSMSIDNCTHSLFGVSKASGDLLVQEYGRYFHMPTVCFRPGCVTGPSHRGTELHGFLSYLTKCVVYGLPYTVFGYDGKQVRCNIHSHDLVSAFEAFWRDPREAAVYNIGSGRAGACSMIEAIMLAEGMTGRALDWEYEETPRIGDHRWWISDISEFQTDYPDWEPEYDLMHTLSELVHGWEE